MFKIIILLILSFCNSIYPVIQFQYSEYLNGKIIKANYKIEESETNEEYCFDLYDAKNIKKAAAIIGFCSLIIYFNHKLYNSKKHDKTVRHNLDDNQKEE